MVLKERIKTSLKVGDTVMVIAGGSGKKRENKGKTGKILKFVGKDRVIVEGLNFMVKHQKQSGPTKPAQRLVKEGAMHISNVMYYVQKIEKTVRISKKFLEDGKKVRGYMDPTTKDFVQI